MSLNLMTTYSKKLTGDQLSLLYVLTRK